MGVLIGFLITLLVILIGLSVVLAIVFIRLGQDMKRLEGNTESLVERARGIGRGVRVVLPLVALLQKTVIRRLHFSRSAARKGVDYEGSEEE